MEKQPDPHARRVVPHHHHHDYHHHRRSRHQEPLSEEVVQTGDTVSVQQGKLDNSENLEWSDEEEEVAYELKVADVGARLHRRRALTERDWIIAENDAILPLPSIYCDDMM